MDKDNHLLIVDLLCSLTQGLTSKWIMNKAQVNRNYGCSICRVRFYTSVYSNKSMIVLFVGNIAVRNSPKFIYALQQLVQFSNEFIQDPSSVQLAQV